jgi:hypothetical protein
VLSRRSSSKADEGMADPGQAGKLAAARRCVDDIIKASKDKLRGSSSNSINNKVNKAF